MHPVLLSVGGFEIHSFGLMMAIAWIAAAAYLDAEFRRAGWPRDAVSDVVMWSLAGTLVGARSLYLIVEYPSWTSDAWSAVFSRSGFVYYGGLFGGLAAGIWLVRRRGLPVRAVADSAAPAMALGLFFGRIGCFLAGDDYGRASDVLWAVTFTDPASLAPLGVRLHPTQLYLSLNGLVLFGILHAALRRRRFEGQVFSLFLMLYSVTRFILEYFRGDPRGQFGPFSTSQWIGMTVFPAGVWMYTRWRCESSARTR